MAEAWDTQLSSPTSVAWDTAPYEPFKCIEKAFEETKDPPRSVSGQSQKHSSDDGTLKTALEWVTNKPKFFQRENIDCNGRNNNRPFQKTYKNVGVGNNTYHAYNNSTCNNFNTTQHRDSRKFSERRDPKHFRNEREGCHRGARNGHLYEQRSQESLVTNERHRKRDFEDRNSRKRGEIDKFQMGHGHNGFNQNWRQCDESTRDNIPFQEKFGRGGNRGRPHRGHDKGRGNWQRNNSGKSSHERNRSSSPPKLNEERKKFPMGFMRLKALVEEDKEEIMLTAINSRSGFQLLLSESFLKTDVMVLVLEVLGKACDSNQSRSTAELFRMVNENKNFSILVMRYLLSLTSSDICSPNQIESLSYLLWYLLSFQRVLPALGSDSVAMLLPLIRDTVNKLAMADKLDNLSVLDFINQLEQENDDIMKNSSKHDLQVRIFEEESHLKPPPNNFRALSIFPTKEDLEDSEPFLRPIVTAGGYSDTEHYLDVQFRLLREDFVRPLREGIVNYKQARNKEKLRDISGIRIYRGVHVLFPRCTLQGVQHNICFDTKYFRKIDWEASKRLLPGSLVCLSSNDFDTMLFAEVSSRDPKLIAHGIFDIRFDSVDECIMKLRPSETFVMLETSAYFEAYRHNLRKLQILDDNSLPFSEHIVKVNKEIATPSYLKNIPRVAYDLRPLMIPFPDMTVARIVMHDKEFYTYEFPGPIGNGKKVEILKQDSWPPPHELNVDQNQYCALQTALTKRFSVIQGPPGTGKTYIGLRVIQTLIHNREVWKKHSDTPILVVCYTNHALDQFLEGILTFTNSLVRIGGQCSNEHLASHKLSYLRDERRSKRLMAISMFNSIHDSVKNLKTINYQVENVEKLLTKLKHTVVTERDLDPYMEEHLLESLRMQKLLAQRLEFVDDGKFILDWLELRLRDHYVPKWLQDEDLTENDDENENTKETVECQSDDGMEATTEDIEGSEDIVDEDDKDLIEIVDKKGDTEQDQEFSDDEEAQWKTINGFKKMTAYIEKQLKKDKMMTPEEIENITDIWQLSLESRWSLYKAWVARYARSKLESILTLVKKYQEELMRLRELRHTEDLNILRSVCVVGMTTTGAAKYEELVRDLHPKIVIVEEAAEVLEAHIITSLSSDTEHLILIGDHQQLRPNPTIFELGEKYNLSISLFERMVKNGFPCQKLVVQHRMRPSIRRLLTPYIYPKLIDHSKVKVYGHIKGLVQKVFFIDHNVSDSSERDSDSFVNIHEAMFVIALCKYLLLQEYKPSQITILSTYSRQTYLIQKMAQKNPIFNGVEISSVDNYQGEENDIVLVSFVRSNEAGRIGFLKTSNRVCVALSRAKKGLYCIGNFQLLAEKNDLWKNITTHLESKNQIGSAIQLVCQNHPEVSISARTAADFKQAPEGGCKQMCQYRLEKCGHTCPKVCHPCDREHKIFRCIEKCNRVPEACPRDHRCKKPCSECIEKGSCGSCIVQIRYKLPCEHKVKVSCGNANTNIVCPCPCQHLLKCSHKCNKTCGEACAVSCQEIVVVLPKDSPCGHSVRIECCLKTNRRELLTRCDKACDKELVCGHKCHGSCGACLQGRFHERCQDVCSRILVCGHKCTAYCSTSCPPCKQTCENHCAHSPCKQECGRPCRECNMPCVLKCPHRKCDSLCREACEVEPCSKPCKKTLKCGHRCIGLCGDPCPRWCRVCNREEVRTMFFGTEEEKGAMFVELKDCGHIFEVGALHEWMETFKSGPIRMPSCPSCRKVTWINIRFSSVVKSCHAKMEKLKEQAFGTREELQKERDELKSLCESLDKNMENSTRLQIHRVYKVLGEDKQLNRGMIATLRNLVNFLEIVNKCLTVFNKIKLFLSDFRINSCSLYDTVHEMQKDALALITKVIKQNDQFSQQQLMDLEREIDRFRLLCTLIQELYQNSTSQAKTHQKLFEVAYEVLTNFLYLSKEDILLKVNPAILKLKSLRGAPFLCVTEEERIQIVQAVGLSQGHWYQCANGHVYCIDRCGGPMEEGQCPECHGLIGGTDHRLVPGNKFAPDVDGAEYPSYSDAANLANFNPAAFE